MTTWMMPEPPPEQVETVWDNDGAEWSRFLPDGSEWWRVGQSPVSWQGLVWRRGPISDVPPSEQD